MQENRDSTKNEPPASTPPLKNSETMFAVEKSMGDGLMREAVQERNPIPEEFITKNLPAQSKATTSARREKTKTDANVVKAMKKIQELLPYFLTIPQIVSRLQQQNIPPNVTLQAYSQLEKHNADFFKAYHLKLKIRDQVACYNYLVLKQREASNRGKK